MKYITGIVTYGEKSTKKESVDVIRNMDNTGNFSYINTMSYLLNACSYYYR